MLSVLPAWKQTSLNFTSSTRLISIKIKITVILFLCFGSYGGVFDLNNKIDFVYLKFLNKQGLSCAKLNTSSNLQN